jgi:hypothetical protein
MWAPKWRNSTRRIGPTSRLDMHILNRSTRSRPIYKVSYLNVCSREAGKYTPSFVSGFSLAGGPWDRWLSPGFNFWFCQLHLWHETTLRNIVVTIVPLPFWHKLNYFSFFFNFGKVFIICVKLLIKPKKKNIVKVWNQKPSRTKFLTLQQYRHIRLFQNIKYNEFIIVYNHHIMRNYVRGD